MKALFLHKARRLGWALMICLLLLVVGGITRSSAQQRNEQIPAPPPPKDHLLGLPLASNLYDAVQGASSWQKQGLNVVQQMRQQGLEADAAGRVLVEISGPEGSAAPAKNYLARYSVETTGNWRHLTEAWIPLARLVEFAKSLPPGYFVRGLGFNATNDVDGEGPVVTNSDGYRDNGANCSNLVIGVFDFGFDNLSEAVTNGDAPPVARRIEVNLSTTSFQDPNDGEHGTGVTETVYDHCPGATYRLYKLDGDSRTDFGDAINDAIANNVNIIAHSLSWYNTGWADDTGEICAAITDSSANDILFFNSAGNRATSHWQGNFSTTDGDSWHEWSNGDEALQIDVPSGDGGYFALSWNTAGGTYDYDLYLYDSGMNELASSENTGNTFEEFSWTNTSGSTQTVYLGVSRYSGGVTEMELFNHGWGTWEAVHILPANSTDSPSNCTNMGLLSIGAVDWNNYGLANPAIESYSSRGPTNSGHQAPHLSSPTNTTAFTYPGGFGGTSCAAPNAAGVAGAFWSEHNSFYMWVVRELLLDQARIYKDWGTSGADYSFGIGGIFLHPYHFGTVWIDRGFGNGLANPGMPYAEVLDAQTAAPSGGRVVFLGGNYPEIVTLDKNLLYETIDGSATLGSP